MKEELLCASVLLESNINGCRNSSNLVFSFVFFFVFWDVELVI